MTEKAQKKAAEPNVGATLGEAARQLQMSAATVRRWAENGWLPSTVAENGERRFVLSVTKGVSVTIDKRAPRGDGRRDRQRTD